MASPWDRFALADGQAGAIPSGGWVWPARAVTVGNTTEGALLLWLAAGAWFRTDGMLDYADLRRQYAVLFQIHFSSDRKRMTTVAEREGRAVVLVKGAPEAILAQDLPGAHDVRDSQAFGRGAQVLMDGDVVFLSMFGNRWLITAAGCQPRGDRPYDCTLKGG